MRSFSFFIALTAGVAFFLRTGSGSVEAAPFSPGNSQEAGLRAAETNTPVREISPGVFQLGLVTIRSSARTVEFPAVVNMDRGPVEYLLVHELGKIHESVFKTAASPFHLHLASLLLQPSKTNAAASSGPAEINGGQVRIEVRAETNNAVLAIPGEDFVFNRKTGAAMERGAWVYNESRVAGGLLLAARDGSIAAVISDPDALLNGLRAGRDQDDLWFVNTNRVFSAGTPVTFILRFNRDE